MRGFSISLKGRLKNFNLPKNQPLIPLYEAIVNSIHAIEESLQIKSQEENEEYLQRTKRVGKSNTKRPPQKR